MTQHNESVSQLLQQWRKGNADAGEQVLAATYEELRRIARGMMRGERPNHTLQPTALVHEAYLRLFQDDPVGLASRVEFLRFMAVQMKRQLIDHARRRNADKRGAGALHKNMDDVDVAAVAPDEDPEVFLARLDVALSKLETEHPRVAEIMRLRFMQDLSIDETAKVLKLGSGTVKRDFAFGRVWMMRELGA
jgi:RNA polymerase sigma factor (TIGR02999 family)